MYIYIYIYIHKENPVYIGFSLCVYIYTCIYYIYIYIYIYKICDHEITQTIQFAETSFQHFCINRNLRNFIELLIVTSGV